MVCDLAKFRSRLLTSKLICDQVKLVEVNNTKYIIQICVRINGLLSGMIWVYFYSSGRAKRYVLIHSKSLYTCLNTICKRRERIVHRPLSIIVYKC